jgi:hypothetical protein
MSKNWVIICSVLIPREALTGIVGVLGDMQDGNAIKPIKPLNFLLIVGLLIAFQVNQIWHFVYQMFLGQLVRVLHTFLYSVKLLKQRLIIISFFSIYERIGWYSIMSINRSFS